MKVGIQLDLMGAPVVNFRVDQGTSFPSPAVEGQHYYRTDLHDEYVCITAGSPGTWAPTATAVIPDATTAVKGIARIATTTESNTGTDDATIMTPAKVKARIDALIAAAPGALDTLKELADAIGDDANFASTMTTALAGKAPTVHGHVLTDANITGVLPVSKGGTGGTTQADVKALVGVDGTEVKYERITSTPALTAGTWTKLTTLLLDTKIFDALIVDATTHERMILGFRADWVDEDVWIKADVAIAANSYWVILLGRP